MSYGTDIPDIYWSTKGDRPSSVQAELAKCPLKPGAHTAQRAVRTFVSLRR
jgi:hypothetical protein